MTTTDDGFQTIGNELRDPALMVRNSALRLLGVMPLPPKIPAASCEEEQTE